jgi:hypothetical protein
VQSYGYATGRPRQHAEVISYTVLTFDGNYIRKEKNERREQLPLMASSVESNLPAKRKRTTNPKLLDDDNMSLDAIKRRKMETAKSSSLTTASTSKSSLDTLSSGQSSKTKSRASRQASVEVITDEDDTCSNAGPPKDPNRILESTDEEDEEEEETRPVAKKATAQKTKKTNPAEGEGQKEKSKEESDEEELGKSRIYSPKPSTKYPSARLQKDWRSKVYAFFQPEVSIKYIDDRKCHEFTCNAKSCKGKGKNPRVVRRFLDTKDKASTKTLRVHAINCWGRENVDKSENANDIASARDALQGAELRDGSITAEFERTGKGKITYSHRAHTEEETRYGFF